jgi:hypothetical protein
MYSSTPHPTPAVYAPILVFHYVSFLFPSRDLGMAKLSGERGGGEGARKDERGIFFLCYGIEGEMTWANTMHVKTPWSIFRPGNGEFVSLKELSHEMDLAIFDDMYG